MIVFKYLFLSLFFICISMAEEVGIPYIPLAHAKDVNFIDNNKTILISGSEDSTVKIWDIAQKKLIKTFKKHKFPIQYVKLIPKENLVLSIDKKSQLYLWNIKTEKIIKEYKLPLENFSSLSYIPTTTLLFMSGEKTIILNLLTGKEFDATFFYKGYYSLSKFSKTAQDEKKILVQTPNEIILYDINGTLEQNIPYQDRLCTAALSNDLKYIAATFDTKEMLIWDRENGKLLKTIKTKKGCGNDSLEFSPSSKYIGLGSGYEVYVWDVEESKEILYAHHDGQIHDNTFSFIDDHSYLVGLWNGKVKYFNIDKNKEIPFNTYSRQISKVAFSKDSKQMYASNHPYFQGSSIPKKYYSILNYKTKEETKLFLSKREELITALSLNKKRLTLGHFNGFITIWDLKKKVKIKEKKVFDDSIEYIDISEDKNMLALTNHSGEVTVLDTNSSEILFNIKNNQEYSRNLKFSPNGEYLLYVDSYSYKVWKTSNWKNQLDANITVSSSLGIEFKDNNTLLMVEDDSIVEYSLLTKEKRNLFNLKAFIVTNKLADNDMYQLNDYQFSHDRNTLLFTVNNKTYILNLKTKVNIPIELLFENSGFLSKTFDFNFNDTIVSTVYKFTLHQWDVNTGKKIDTYSLYTQHMDNYSKFFEPRGDIGISYSKNSHLVASAVSQTLIEPSILDKINIWDIEKIKVTDRLTAEQYQYISDFVVSDKKIIYASDSKLTEVNLEGNKTTEVKTYDIHHQKILLWKDKYLLDMFKNELYLIDKEKNKRVKTFKTEEGDFISAFISPNGKEIMSFTKKPSPNRQYNDKNLTMVIYDIETGKTLGKNTIYADAVEVNENADMFALIINSIGTAQDALLGSYPSMATIVNIKNNEVAMLKGHKDTINSIAFSKDNTSVVTGSKDGTMKLWNTSSGELLHTYSGHEGSVNSVMFHPEKPYIVSASSDGTIRYWNIKNNQLVVTFISFDNEWVVLTPEGFFNGTQKGIKALNILYDPVHIGEMSNVFDIFFRPDLVKLKLNGTDISVYTKNTNLKRALKNKPPIVKLSSINKMQVDKEIYYTNQENATLTFNVNEHDGGSIGLIRIYQEGKLIQTIGEGKVNKQSANIDTIIEQEKLDSTVKENQKTYIASLSKSIQGDISIEGTIAKVKPKKTTNRSGTYELEIELKSGKNEISIEAFNKTNTVTSYRENITINANIPKQKPKLYAIVAGVNEFEAPSVNNLKYSQNDAQTIKKTAEQQMKTVFDEVEVIYLTGKEVTKENILKAAQNIAKKAKLDDTVLFYISTHGRAARGKLYLVPYNNKSVKNWIDFEQTFQAVQSIKALNQIFIIDACESGKANDIVSSVYDSRASVLAKSSGVHMLLATTKGTFAFEHPDKNIKNGVFTYRILEALKDHTIDTNKDSLISILELSKKLKEPANNVDYQYPVIRNVGKDVDLERINE